MNGPTASGGPRRIVITGAAARGPILAVLATMFGMLVGAVFFIAATIGEIFGADGFLLAFAVWVLGWSAGAVGTYGLLARRSWRHLLLVAGGSVQIVAGILVSDAAAAWAGLLFASPAIGLLAAAGGDWARGPGGPVKGGHGDG